MIYLLNMEQLIRKVLKESKEVKNGDFSGLENVSSLKDKLINRIDAFTPSILTAAGPFSK